MAKLRETLAIKQLASAVLDVFPQELSTNSDPFTSPLSM
ncbi:MAG: D-3-phosphoglycerate dehydrogenase [Sodalis sp.]|nr:MAG: D-3-phosphoglycerate dehydrogenase [Sodalis sp.]